MYPCELKASYRAGAACPAIAGLPARLRAGRHASAIRPARTRGGSALLLNAKAAQLRRFFKALGPRLRGGGRPSAANAKGGPTAPFFKVLGPPPAGGEQKPLHHELQPRQPRITPAPSHELLMPPHLHDPAVVQHHDAVRLLHRREPVR